MLRFGIMDPTRETRMPSATGVAVSPQRCKAGTTYRGNASFLPGPSLVGVFTAANVEEFNGRHNWSEPKNAAVMRHRLSIVF